MKLKTIYTCSSCGAVHNRWTGQCASCMEWNSLVEDCVDESEQKSQVKAKGKLSLTPRKISDVSDVNIVRIDTKISELNRVLGGGLVPGSVTLLGGEPGIGKSTLSLQLLDNLDYLERIIYVAGEESVEQISLRASRLNLKLENVDFLENNIYEYFITYIKANPAGLIILDSIQVLKSIEQGGNVGGINQIRYLTEQLVLYAKKENVPMILIGHVTKDGELAGPKLLEHLVDTVLYIEGDKINSFRFVKSAKNRFGATDEVGIFKMNEMGLQEVPDPAAEFMEEREKEVIGSALGCIIEGNRPILIEVQALTVKSNFGYPKRSTTGFDQNRLAMILAVLQKHYDFDLSEFDVFVNVSGGFKIKETACDLAVMQAIASSFKNLFLDQNYVYVGEISLSGKVKKVSHFDLRKSEITRLGFKLKTNFKEVE